MNKIFGIDLNISLPIYTQKTKLFFENKKIVGKNTAYIFDMMSCSFFTRLKFFKTEQNETSHLLDRSNIKSENILTSSAIYKFLHDRFQSICKYCVLFPDIELSNESKNILEIEASYLRRFLSY